MNASDSVVDIAVLIPAYNPDQRLTTLVSDLHARGFSKIVLVNDGSAEEYRALFDDLENFDYLDLCEHAVNQGKGAALKTGFRFLQGSSITLKGVITADADGQHLSEDIYRLAQAARDYHDGMLLGCRCFGEGTPLRSMVGNRATSTLMKFVHGISVSDTQTGLRYLPCELLPHMLMLSGDGYEFELQCLIRAKELGVKLIELPIKTVYIDDNSSSHFLPIIDSIRIYSVLFRFGGSSLVCSILDVTIFAWIFWLSRNVMLATIFARVVSGVVNFLLNKHLVFNSRKSGAMLREALSYLVLWLVLMLGSGSIVALFTDQSTTFVIAVKVLVDVSLFILCFWVQSRFVFANRPC